MVHASPRPSPPPAPKTPRRLARPLSVEEIRQILAHIDRTSPIGIRDTAMILLGYASAMRRAELVALTLDGMA